MQRGDLRDNIMPTVLENTDEDCKYGNIKFNTTDVIYLEKQDGICIKRIPCTDYAIMNNLYVTDNWVSNDRKGYKSFRTPYFKYQIAYSGGSGQSTSNTNIGLCPSLHYKIPSEINELNITLKEYEDGDEYYTLDIGEYPNAKADEELSAILEKMYNNGDCSEDIICTGRWFSNNGLKDRGNNYAGRHYPEFEYKGERYVRVSSTPNSSRTKYSDGTMVGDMKTIRWVKVEPISFIIKNWDRLPKSVNPKGTEEDSFFDLTSENIIISGIPFYPYEGENNANMWQNSTVRGFFNGIDVRDIVENGNPEFTANGGGNFESGCNFLNEAFNLTREPMIEYTIPDSERIIPRDAFNGCVTLKRLTIHNNIISIGERAFEGLKFRYLYVDKSNNLIFSDEELENGNEYLQKIVIDDFLKVFDKFDYNILVRGNNANNVIKLAHKLEKGKMKIPYMYALILLGRHIEEGLYSNSEFKFFRNEIPNAVEMLEGFTDEEKINFFKFAQNLGCFSKEKIKDRDGKETKVMIAQKASTFLASALKNDGMKLGNYHGLFNLMSFNLKPNQDFLNFISVHDGKNGFANLELLLELEKEAPGIFAKVMENFEKVKLYKETLDENGKPVSLSWEKAFKKYYFSTRYTGIDENNEDIAVTFASRGIPQTAFDEATELRKKFVEDKIPEHILAEKLKEESILESIERIKEQTDLEMITVKQLIDELYNKQFTYEWLNKNDPKNYILGLYCSCCATITGNLYGKKIATAGVIADDVQNIVVRDLKGEIVSKGSVYVDRKNGYAVINEFELNKKYRNCEIRLGEYLVPDDHKEEIERELIFKAFQRGIYAFVQKYNEENPSNSIKQVNVGYGYNRLKRQVDRLQKAPLILEVPEEYSFKDAQARQFIIYPPQNENIEKETEEVELVNDEI